MLEFLRSLVESGAITSATVLAATFIAAGLVKACVHAYPTWVRESIRRAAGRQALTGRTKADRDRAYEILRLMEPPEKGG